MTNSTPIDRDQHVQKSQKSEKEWREQDERLRLALQATGLGTWEMDLVNNKRTWSNETRAMHGLAHVEDSSAHVELDNKVIHPDDRVRLNILHDELRAGRDDYAFEYRTLREDGTQRWIMARGKVLERDGRGPTRIVGVCIDTTRQKHADEDKRFYESQFRFLANAMPQLVWIADAAGRVTYFNDRRRHYAEAPEADVGIGQWQPMLHPDDLPATLDAWAEALRNVHDYEMEHRLKMADGKYAWHLSRASPATSDSGHLMAWFGTATDIDRLKKADDSTARMAAVAAASHDALYGASLDGYIEAWNPSAEVLLGYTEAEALGQHITMLAHPGKHDEQISNLKRVGNGETIRPFDTVRQTKDGRQVDVSIAMSPVYAPDNTVTAISVALHDISERKEWDTRKLLMNRELAHRVKNSFAVLQAILRSTLKSTPDPTQFAAAFSSRLHSLAAAHDVLTANEWRGAELGALLRHQLAFYLTSQRIRLTGDPVSLGAEQAAPFSLIVNELATNAAKYGALSVAAGIVDVSWHIERSADKPDSLVFSWRESGGPEIRSSGPRGFGSILIERSLADADVTLNFAHSGLNCLIRCPMSAPTGSVAQSFSEN